MQKLCGICLQLAYASMGVQFSDRQTPFLWETSFRCPRCKTYMRPQGITWVEPNLFYFRLKCSGCALRLKGKKTSQKVYEVDWLGMHGILSLSKPRKATRFKRYQTARRK